MKTWQETGFDIETTGDGSQTLRVTGNGESMHHSGGALEETLMIYGRPLTEVFARIERPRVFSLGLGIGYCELVTAAAALKAGKSYEMVTMELVEELKTAFLGWLRGEFDGTEIARDLEIVTASVAAATGTEGEALKESLRLALKEERWILLGALTPTELPPGRYHALLYDIFSAKTAPDLWTEEFLLHFLETCSEADTLFSTFACTGNLKRALRARDYQVIQRDGFKGKRHSTLGRRGIFVLPEDEKPPAPRPFRS